MKISSAFLFASILVCLALSGHAQSVTSSTTTAVADTFVDSAFPSNNYGAAGAMQVVAPTVSNTNETLDSLIKFNLANTVASLNTTYGTGQWAITSIALSLGSNFGIQGTQPGNAIFAPVNAGQFGITDMQNTSWIEGTGTPGAPTMDGITYGTLNSYLTPGADRSLGSFTYTPPGSNSAPPVKYSLALDPSFLSAVGSGGLVSLELYAADNGVSYLFNSRTYTNTPANQPMLIVTATPVPEPAPAALSASGLLILGLFMRVRRASLA